MTLLLQELLSIHVTGVLGMRSVVEKMLEDIERNMGMVIEGISTTKVAYEIAQELGVYMPITTAIYKSIYEGADIKEIYSQYDVQ